MIEGLKKTTKTLSQNSPSQTQDFILETIDYERLPISRL